MTGKKLDGILINASNLHYGGAVQVATSFLNELTYLDSKKYNLIVSREVHNELIIMNSNLDAFHSYMVYDVSGVKALLDYKFTKIMEVL